jgi:hypothetical protein
MRKKEEAQGSKLKGKERNDLNDLNEPNDPNHPNDLNDLNDPITRNP